jgi:hypothetical protein
VKATAPAGESTLPSGARAVTLTTALGTAPRPARLAPPVAPAPTVALGRGLTGYWRFDDGPGSVVARDSSGGAHDCTLTRVRTGGLVADGTMGGGLRLGDSGGWVSCDASSLPMPAGAALTVSAWVKPEKVRRFHQAVVARQREPDGAHYFFLGVHQRSAVMVSEVWGVRLARPLPHGLHHWVHLAFTRSEAGAVRLFVDGLPAGEATAAPGGEAALSGRLTLGYARDVARNLSKQRFRGQLDELAIYDRALSLAEIAALAAGTQPPL